MGHFDNIIIRPQTGETDTQGVGTIYQDLPEKGHLSCLMVDLACKVLMDTNPGLDMWNIFTKFEVLVDGSKVVKSYDAKQLRAIAHYSGMSLSQLGWYEAGNYTGDKIWWNFPILFGRYPGDPEYMLDMERYSNPQLRVTYNADQITADGETYVAQATPYVQSAVQGLIYRKGVPPDLKGYIKSTEIDNWSIVINTTRQTEIPRGNDVIGYMQGARWSDDRFIEYFAEHELTFDNGEWQLYDHGYQEMKSLDAMWYPRPVEMRLRKELSDTLPLDLCMGVCNQFGGWNHEGTTAHVGLEHEGSINIQDVRIRTNADAAVTAKTAEVYMSGQFPHQNIYIPLWRYSEDGEFGIDTTKYGRIDIKTTTGGTGNTGANLQTVAEYVIPTGE